MVSCDPSEKDLEKPGLQQAASKDTSPVKCYRYASETDTITLKLIHIGKSITGTLVYNLKEKDKNKGTIQGSMRRNLLIADYTFMSEGIQSIRQIAFKLEGNSFVEGYGDVLSRNEQTFFKNLDSLSFNTSIKLAEMPCR